MNSKVSKAILALISICIFYQIGFYGIMLKKTLITENVMNIPHQFGSNACYIVFYIMLGFICTATNTLITRHIEKKNSYKELLTLTSVGFVSFAYIIEKIFGTARSHRWIMISDFSISAFEIYLIFGIVFVPQITKALLRAEDNFWKRYIYFYIWVFLTVAPALFIFQSFLLMAFYIVGSGMAYLVLESEKRKWFSVLCTIFLLAIGVLYMEHSVEKNFLFSAAQRLFAFTESQHSLLFDKELLGMQWGIISMVVSILIPLLLIVYVYQRVKNEADKKICYLIVGLMALIWVLIYLEEMSVIGIAVGNVPFSTKNAFCWLTVVIVCVLYGRKNDIK